MMAIRSGRRLVCRRVRRGWTVAVRGCERTTARWLSRSGWADNGDTVLVLLQEADEVSASVVDRVSPAALHRRAILFESRQRLLSGCTSAWDTPCLRLFRRFHFIPLSKPFFISLPRVLAIWIFNFRIPKFCIKTVGVVGTWHMGRRNELFLAKTLSSTEE